jgi:hypothetical protein
MTGKITDIFTILTMIELSGKSISLAPFLWELPTCRNCDISGLGKCVDRHNSGIHQRIEVNLIEFNFRTIWLERASWHGEMLAALTILDPSQNKQGRCHPHFNNKVENFGLSSNHFTEGVLRTLQVRYHHQSLRCLQLIRQRHNPQQGEGNCTVATEAPSFAVTEAPTVAS